MFAVTTAFTAIDVKSTWADDAGASAHATCA